MTATYIALATITLTGSDGSITFSSIPATYRDLILVVGSARSASGNPAVVVTLNGDSSSNYSFVRMIGNGSTATSASGTGTSITLAAGGIVTGESATMIAHFMDYSVTNKQKTILNRHNLASVNVEAFAHRWANTAAVTSMEVFTTSSLQFASGTTISLYGIN